MNLDRRSLMLGIFAVVAAPAIVRASSLMPVKSWVPTLWCDGIHDDHAALQALFDHEPFRVAKSFPGRVDCGAVFGGDFSISDTIIVRKNGVSLYNSRVEARDGFKGEFLLDIKNTATDNHIYGGHFDSRGMAGGIIFNNDAVHVGRGNSVVSSAFF